MSLLLLAKQVSIFSHAAPLGTSRQFFCGRISARNRHRRRRNGRCYFHSPRSPLFTKPQGLIGDVIASTYKDGLTVRTCTDKWMATNAGRAIVSLANLQSLCTQACGTGIELRARQDRRAGHPRAASRPRWASIRLARDTKPIAQTGRIRLEPEYPRAFDAISKT
ncbi:hypothetical protein CGRA01v4_05554 [Colletotrichum graminicola]|nr:hypothetical protein CGRA01v4_05554 [Colletotrichum graminicola]